MKYDYSYEDFEKAAKDSGFYGEFSDYDLSLARRYPEVGMTLLQFKKDYAGADTAEQKARINRSANELRGVWGGYSGGRDGSAFYALAAPDSDRGGEEAFRERAAPVWTGSAAAEKRDGLLEALKTDRFTYDRDSDPAWNAYAAQYRREGKRAAEDALGAAAANTGGAASSYAVTAAAQAGDVYAARLADKTPELERAAYERWLDEEERKLRLAGEYDEQAQAEYARFSDERRRFETDRAFDYAAWLDRIERGDAERKREAEEEARRTAAWERYLDGLSG